MASYIDDAVEVLDISDPTNPSTVGSIVDDATTELNGARFITVSGNYAYVAGGIDDGIEILDISDPTKPTHVGARDNTACGVQCKLDGPYSIDSCSETMHMLQVY